MTSKHAPRVTIKAHEGRTPEALRHHYEVERELADRLRAATRAERGPLYGQVYDDLFRRVPDHPQLVGGADAAGRAEKIDRLLGYVDRYVTPQTHFMEIGAGDCALSRRVAERAAKVTAVEVSAEIVPDDLPANVEVALSDGTSVDARDVDVAFSNQLMEHLHPDDARAQLENIYAALRPGGRYICVTPNRLTGPYDVSRFFTPTATAFHLREYTIRELSGLMRAAGFRKVVGIVPRSSGALEHPLAPLKAAEVALGVLPHSVRQRLPRPAERLLNIRVVAVK